jgi:hypothetical protein
VQVVTGLLNSTGRVGLLTTSDEGGERLMLRLQILKTHGHGVEERDIGRPVNLRDIEGQIEEIKESVERALLDPSVFSDEFREQGTRLARLFMDRAGENRLASYFGLIDTLVVMMCERTASVPWEWLRPTPTSRDPAPRSLGECFDIVRWPAGFMDDAVDSLAPLSTVAVHQPIQQMVTVGLPVGASAEWRIDQVRTVRDLFELTRGCATFHLVGHIPRDAQYLHVLERGPRLTKDGLRANIAHAPQAILSGCEAGVTRFSTNLAIELSLTSGCTVWAPLVRIRQSDAEQLDLALADAARRDPKATVATLLRKRRESGDPIGSVYACYGLAKGDYA